MIVAYMNGAELIRRIRKLGKETDTIVRFESRYGKGSHGRLYYGPNFTTVKDPMVLTFFLILNKLKINHFKYLEKVSELFTTLSQFLSLK